VPNFSGTRAAIAFGGGGGTFIPPRFSGTPARLRFRSGVANFTILGEPVKPRIERLQRFEPSNGKERVSLPGAGTAQTTFREQVVQQRNAEGIEKAFDSLQSQVLAIEQVLNLTREALRQATEVSERVSIAGSYTNPTSVVSGNSSGVVTIAAHNRIYTDADNTTVTVDAGSLTGFTPGQTVTVYYNDNARTGGAVTYLSSMMAVAQEGITHVVGRVTIPQAGDPPATGGGPVPPGYVPLPDGGSEDILGPDEVLQ
jgi:hypothetical protein